MERSTASEKVKKVVRESLERQLREMRFEGPMTSTAFAYERTRTPEQNQYREEANRYFEGLWERQIRRQELRILAYS